MMRSLFSGVSGLKNHQTRMDVIGNNISNVNTTGYKSSRVTFTDTLQQTLSGASAPTDNLGGTNPKQIGLGSALGSIDMIMTDGSVQTTGKNTDLCLSGNGFFVVEGSNGTFYTRDGAFEFDSKGNYVLPGSGLYVLGWTNTGTPGGTESAINTLDEPKKITIQAGKSMKANATTEAIYSNNLDAGSVTIKEISGGESRTTDTKTYNNAGDGAVTASMSHTVALTVTGINSPATTAGTNGATYQVGNGISVALAGTGNSVTIDGMTVKATLTLADGTTISDPAGGTYTIGAPYGTSTIKSMLVTSTISKMEDTYVVDATASEDNPVTLTMSDGSIYTQSNGKFYLGNSLPVSTIVTAYDSLGNAHSIPVFFTKTNVDTSGVTGNTWTISVSNDVKANTNSWTEEDGSVTTVTLEPITLQFDTNGKCVSSGSAAELTLTNGSSTGQKIRIDYLGLTQYSGSSTIANSADGNAMGTLKSISIDSAGVITGTYTNGINWNEAQVAIAQFNNAAGLTKTGSSLYQISNNSGNPSVKTATDLGVTITPSALEMSNVDIANEFSDMIITQRGFQSNSKIITVSDEMLETLVNMKR